MGRLACRARYLAGNNLLFLAHRGFQCRVNFLFVKNVFSINTSWHGHIRIRCNGRQQSQRRFMFRNA